MNRRLPVLLVLLAAGCAGFGRFASDLGEYTWVEDLPAAAAPADEYLLGEGDLLQVRVFNQDGLSARTRVRRDGRISLPLLDDVVAAGSTPKALALRLQGLFKEFVNNPLVTVSVEEPRQLQLAVLGEVARPGLYPLSPGAGVLQALASAGGLTDFGHRDRVFVLRGTGKPQRIRFDLDKLTRTASPALRFALIPGDALIVE